MKQRVPLKANELILRFKSPMVRLGVPEGVKPSTMEVDGWRVRDEYNLLAETGLPADVGQYRLVIERDVTIDDNVSALHAAAVDFIERVNQVWTVAAGIPFGRSGFSRLLANVQTPSGWESNVDDVEYAVQAATGPFTAKISVEGREWFHGPTLPLARVVTALRAYPMLDDITKELLDLHYRARHAPSGRRELLLAKALEIVRPMLPGKTDIDREHSLPAEIRARLTRPIAWLFYISNTRLETRHALRTKRPPALQPKLTDEEASEFLRNADLLVRQVIGAALGLDAVVIQ